MSLAQCVTKFKKKWSATGINFLTPIIIIITPKPKPLPAATAPE
jgi:hypothetical protein